MFDIFRNIIISPFWTIGATIVLWGILYLTFLYLKLSEKGWKRLEYIWLFIGLFGVLSIVDKNNKEFKSVEAYYLKQNITFNLKHIDVLLTGMQSCFSFNKTSFSPPDFDDRQYDQDQICSWSKNYQIPIDSTQGIPIEILDTLSIERIQFKTKFMDGYVKEFKEYSSKINDDIIKFKEYNNQIKSEEFQNFSKSIGLILLVFAFAIRLSITTRNVKNAK